MCSVLFVSVSFLLDWTVWKWTIRAGDTTASFASTMQTGFMSLAGCDSIEDHTFLRIHRFPDS